MLSRLLIKTINYFLSLICVVDVTCFASSSFASFFTNKVSSLRLSLQTLLPTSTQYDSSPSADKNDSILPPGASFNLFEPATEAEITTLIHASQNKQCDLDP